MHNPPAPNKQKPPPPSNPPLRIWWEVRRLSDPTFPRVYKTEAEANAMVASVTVNPPATKHDLYVYGEPGRLTDQVVGLSYYTVETYSGPAKCNLQMSVEYEREKERADAAEAQVALLQTQLEAAQKLVSDLRWQLHD